MMIVPAKPRPFPLDRGRCALLVIDMQRDFLDPGGGCPRLLRVPPQTLAEVRRVIAPVVRLRDWARAQGMTIVYTREASLPDLSDLTESKRRRYENAGYPVGTPGPLGRLLVRGEAGTGVIEELAPGPGEWQYDKPAQSAFIGTSLDADLRAGGISHLLFTGVTTQCCVLATCRQASDLGYFALLLEDCCAAYDPRDHQAAVDVLTSENGAVGWVTTSTLLMTEGGS